MRPELLELVLGLLPASHPRPEVQLLYTMLRDYPQRGGKGIRSELLLLSAQAHGLSVGGPGWNGALWLAASVELFQNWVLIHDDIADDSEERRGRPALHREYGMPLALNAGDALHAYMWAAVARAGVPGSVDEMLTMVHRTAEGQHIDLAWVEHGRWDLNPEDYLAMVGLKTAWYTVIMPLRLGALAAGCAPDPRFEEAGLRLGAAFQIRDDVLNLIGDRTVYGKEIGGDLLEGKRTLILLHWLSGASAEQRAHFLACMAQPRSDKRPGDMARLLGWLNDSGATSYAQAYARREAGAGLELLGAALEHVPGQAAAARIVALAEALALREA